MFYTGKDLTQKHGRLPATNSTLASLNEKKFQKRKSEKDLHSLMFPNGSPATTINGGGRYFDEQEIFYREEVTPGYHPNLPDVVSGTNPRNKEAFAQQAFDLRSTTTSPELGKPDGETDDNQKAELESALMRLDLRSMKFDDESDPQYTISGKSQGKYSKSDSNSGKNGNTESNNESETERRTRQKGLKNASNPEMISFREQSEWLDKLVTEELKGQRLKKEKGKIL